MDTCTCQWRYSSFENVTKPSPLDHIFSGGGTTLVWYYPQSHDPFPPSTDTCA